jgi:hypothetical protein
LPQKSRCYPGIDLFFHGVISQIRISGKKLLSGYVMGLISQSRITPHFDIQRLFHGVSHKLDISGKKTALLLHYHIGFNTPFPRAYRSA